MTKPRATLLMAIMDAASRGDYVEAARRVLAARRGAVKFMTKPEGKYILNGIMIDVRRDHQKRYITEMCKIHMLIYKDML